MRSHRLLLLILVLPILLCGQSVDEGVVLMSTRKYADAKVIFESILKKDNKNAAAHYRLGQIFMSNQFLDADEAVDHMEEAVDLNPQSADYHYGLGAALGIKARDAGVIKQAFLAPRVKGAFEKAVQLNPSLVEAHAGLVEYYRRAPGFMGGDMAKAWSEAEVVIGLDELRGRPLKANLFLADKKNAEAAQEIKLLTANRSKDWRAWRVAGNFFFRNQMTDDAITSLEKYASLRPDTADSYTWLARAYVQKKDADKAILNAKKALTLDNDFAQALEALAQAHELKGQKKEAKGFYQKLLSMNPPEERKKNLEKKINELQ